MRQGLGRLQASRIPDHGVERAVAVQVELNGLERFIGLLQQELPGAVDVIKRGAVDSDHGQCAVHRF